MDLSVFNKYQEYQSETERTFNPALRSNNHEDPDMHLIGESVSAPSVISTIGDTASVGSSPVPAREDHSHGYTPYSLPLSDATPTASSTSAGTAGTSTNVSRADHRHQYTQYTLPDPLIRSSFVATSNVTLPNGSNINPALRFSSDTQMGLYKTGSTMVFTDGGSARLEIGSSIRTIDRDFEVTGSLYGFRTDRLRLYFNNITTTDNVDLNLYSPSNYITLNNTVKYITPPAGAFFSVTFNAINKILYINTSTRDIKENIESIDSEYSAKVIDQLDPVSFIYKRAENYTTESEEWRKKEIKHGFIAEDVAEVDTNLALWDLVRDEEGNDLGTGEIIPRSYSEASLLAVAIAELKSLRKRVASLENQLSGKAPIDVK